jgi:hypothetical protein
MRTSGKRLLAGCSLILLLTLLAAAGAAQVGQEVEVELELLAEHGARRPR